MKFPKVPNVPKALMRGFQLAWLCCLAAVAGTASGVEFLADADVLAVDPIMRYQTVTRRADHCIARPHRTAGLMALLTWDLAAGECSHREQTEIIEGYRVTYQWNGRRYHQTLAEHPGTTLPVTIRVQ